MKRLILLLVILITLPLAAQEATLASPDTQPATKLVILEIREQRPCQCIDVTVQAQDTDGTVRRLRTYRISPEDTPSDPGTPAGYFTALRTVRATESTNEFRRHQFRVLGYLLDAGYLPPGTVLVP